MSDENSVSDEILSHAESYIKELLKNKRLKVEVRAQLEIQSYFLTILTVDHERLSQIFPWAKKQQESQMRWAERWEKLGWLIIPVIVTGGVLFLGQFIYFWMVVVPKLVVSP